MEINCYKKPQYIKDLSKDLRKNMTVSEKILWEKLRSGRFFWKPFHRQKALFLYREDNNHDRFLIADFYYHPQKLIIEVDWSIHQQLSIKEYDLMKSTLLEKIWYKILRFSNGEIYSSLDVVLAKIKKYIL